MSGLVDSVSAVIAVRRPEDGSEVSAPFTQATIDALSSALPWRTFRWYRGQRHYSGTFWSSTEHGHVVYESRLELARLLFADFDPSVSRIIAQPFLMRASVNSVLRRHVPDYLLLMDTGPLAGPRQGRDKWTLTCGDTRW